MDPEGKMDSRHGAHYKTISAREFEYKFLQTYNDGSFNWEEGPNRKGDLNDVLSIMAICCLRAFSYSRQLQGPRAVLPVSTPTRDAPSPGHVVGRLLAHED